MWFPAFMAGESEPGTSAQGNPNPVVSESTRMHMCIPTFKYTQVYKI